MCHNWIFLTYYTISKGAMIMENNTSCKVVGIGIVKIKIFDGDVRTLGDVRRVSDLKRNLISLSILDLKRYKFTSKGRVLKVIKDAHVAMKGQRSSAQLYILQCSTKCIDKNQQKLNTRKI